MVGGGRRGWLCWLCGKGGGCLCGHVRADGFSAGSRDRP